MKEKRDVHWNITCGIVMVHVYQWTSPVERIAMGRKRNAEMSVLTKKQIRENVLRME